jgi:hypothetical protein
MMQKYAGHCHQFHRNINKGQITLILSDGKLVNVKNIKERG